MKISYDLIFIVFLLFSLAVFLIGTIWQYEDKSYYSAFKSKRLLNMLCLISMGTAVATGVFSLLIARSGLDFFPLVIFRAHVLSLSLFLAICPFTKFIKKTNIPFRLLKQSLLWSWLMISVFSRRILGVL